MSFFISESVWRWEGKGELTSINWLIDMHFKKKISKLFTSCFCCFWSSLTCRRDDAHCKYIQEAINNAFAAHGTRKKPKGNTNTGGRTSPDGSPCPPLLPSNTDAGLKPQDTPVAASASPHHFSVSVCTPSHLDKLAQARHLHWCHK